MNREEWRAKATERLHKDGWDNTVDTIADLLMKVDGLEKVKITIGKVVSEYKAEISTLKQENKELEEDRDSETRWAKQYHDELYTLKEELDRATENNDELINREQELIKPNQKS